MAQLSPVALAVSLERETLVVLSSALNAPAQVGAYSVTGRNLGKAISSLRSSNTTSTGITITQIWIAVCAYLLLAWINFSGHIRRSIQQMVRLLQLNLFERRELLPLLRGAPPEPPDCSLPQQLQLQ